MLVNGTEASSRDLAMLAAQLARNGEHNLATRIGFAIDRNRNDLVLGHQEARLIVPLMEGQLGLAALRACLVALHPWRAT